MSYLEQIKKPSIEAPVITIASPPGVGKTTLGALFPSPVFINAENGSATFDTWDDDAKPAMLPELPRANKQRGVSTKTVLIDQLRELASVDHPFKTVVVDTVSSLNLLLSHEVCEKYDVENIGEAAGGYNKGYLELAQMHSEIRRAFQFIRNKGLAVVFLCHTAVLKIKNSPDEPEYSFYSLDLEKSSLPFYVHHSDAVLFFKSESFIKGHAEDKKGQTTKLGKIIKTDNRVLITTSSARIGYPEAKNRYKLPPEIPVVEGENPLLDLIPFFNNKTK